MICFGVFLYFDCFLCFLEPFFGIRVWVFSENWQLYTQMNKFRENMYKTKKIFWCLKFEKTRWKQPNPMKI